jgi:hypothetical protein
MVTVEIVSLPDRDLLVAPHSHGSIGLQTVWGMGGRCMDLPRQYQQQALADLVELHPWPADLRKAHLQINSREGEQ